MASATLLLLLAVTPLTRTPVKATAPDVPRGIAWVFFTDKGLFREEEYQAALDAVAHTARPEIHERRLREPIRGFDYDDLPVFAPYLRQVEESGGRLRRVSRWLNAASFELTPAQVRAIYALPFVYDIRPVGFRNTAEHHGDVFPLASAEARLVRGLDTAKAHRFYGPSWEQAQMMGVPDVYRRGYFGSGVRLAIFDTGLKLKNRAVQGVRIFRQHDFVSGDNFHQTLSSGSQPIPQLTGLGLAKDPALHAGRLGLLLAFVADSFAYRYGVPVRAVYASFGSYQSMTWTAPQPVMLSGSNDFTYENLSLTQRDSVAYLALDELNTRYNRPALATVFVGRFVGNRWDGYQTIGQGRWPHLAMVDTTSGSSTDRLHLVYVETDSVITFQRADVTSPTPVWDLPIAIATDEAATTPRVFPAWNGHVTIVARGSSTGRIMRFTSTDGGTTFMPAAPLATSGHGPLVLRTKDSLGVLLYRDDSLQPFARLMSLRTTDWGITWTPPEPVSGRLLSLGEYDCGYVNQRPYVVFESAGLLHTSRWNDTEWTPVLQSDTTGFCYSPRTAAFRSVEGDTPITVWLKRGDDNAVWEDSDTVRFSTEQPHHGTRMVSIICGNLPYSLVGIAPAVDLIVAKTEFHRTASGRPYEYTMEEDTYIEALEWAEAIGADIVSTSLGYRTGYGDNQFDGRTAPISIAADAAARRGLIIVTAMGNRDTTIYPWPVPYIVAPGDADAVITAGGVQKNLSPWRGTGTGPTADGRVKPDLVALSDTVAVASPDSVSSLDGSVGTSCATALIAGACALIKEAHP
ncbi:MAG: S8 family serine peptidase, partial [candidate division WOR-3 bacterium]